MSGAPILQTQSAPARPSKAERSVTGRVLVTVTVLFLTLFIVLPVANVFTQALSNGVTAYWHVFFPPAVDPAAHLTIFQKHRQVIAVRQAADTWNAIRLSCGVAAIVVPLNMIFGIAAAWAITKFRFRGRVLLLTLIDLPFSISPVIAGLVFVLLFGRGGVVGDWATNLTWPDPTSLTWQGFSGHGGPSPLPTLIRHHLHPDCDRARDDIRDLSVRRAVFDSVDGCARIGRGARRAFAWRQRLANFPDRDTAEYQVGPALWRDSVYGACVR